MRVLEKLTVAKLDKKVPAFKEGVIFVIFSTRGCHKS